MGRFLLPEKPGMTVGELIRRLELCDPNLEVRVFGGMDFRTAGVESLRTDLVNRQDQAIELVHECHARECLLLTADIGRMTPRSPL